MYTMQYKSKVGAYYGVVLSQVPLPSPANLKNKLLPADSTV